MDYILAEFVTRLKSRIQVYRLVSIPVAILGIFSAFSGVLEVANYSIFPPEIGASLGQFSIGGVLAVVLVVSGTILGYIEANISSNRRDVEIVKAIESQKTAQLEDRRENQERERQVEMLLAWPCDLFKRGNEQTPSENVLTLQLMLTIAGYTVSSNGLFDEETENAVLAAQSGFRINEDGEAGKITWNKLASEIRRSDNGEELVKLYNEHQPRIAEAREAMQPSKAQSAQTAVTTTPTPDKNL